MQQSATPTPILEARKISKRFPGVRALTDVDASIYPGEVVALLGENGAGKSTLGKILAGVYAPDGGALFVDGQLVHIESVRDAQRLGVAIIHQELNLADNLDVASNLFLGREPRKFGVVIDRGEMERQARAVLDRLGFDVSPRKLVGDLSIGQQQLVEIAKALSIDARVIMMDEPTSSLTQRESEHLFRVVKDLRSRGVAIIYVSHRLSEVKELADRVVVLRDGKNAGELRREDVTHDRMVSLMVGRDLTHHYLHTPHPPGDVVLEVRELRTAMYPRQALSFDVRAGEIVGVAGLVGAGRSELLNTVFGVYPRVGGTVRVAGRDVNAASPIDAIRAGIALVPEDRKRQGLILEMAVRTNVSLPSLRTEQRAGMYRPGVEKELAREAIQRLAIKTPTDKQVVQYLSGGNQQKVVLGKWLALHPRVLLLDEPTRGIDVGAKREIYALMEQLSKQGVAILFVSSELEEVLGMSDRTLVMHEGRLAGELKRDELSEQAIMRLATGAGSREGAK